MKTLSFTLGLKQIKGTHQKEKTSSSAPEEGNNGNKPMPQECEPARIQRKDAQGSRRLLHRSSEDPHVHVKAVCQPSTRIKDPMSNLPVKIDNGPIQMTKVQLTPSLGPVQGTVGRQELFHQCGGEAALERKSIDVLRGD